MIWHHILPKHGIPRWPVQHAFAAEPLVKPIKFRLRMVVTCNSKHGCNSSWVPSWSWEAIDSHRVFFFNHVIIHDFRNCGAAPGLGQWISRGVCGCSLQCRQQMPPEQPGSTIWFISFIVPWLPWPWHWRCCPTLHQIHLLFGQKPPNWPAKRFLAVCGEVEGGAGSRVQKEDSA